MSAVKVAFVPFALQNFDVEWAEEVRQESMAALGRLEGCEVTAPEGFVFSVGDARRAVDALKPDGPEVVVLQCTTFSASGDVRFDAPVRKLIETIIDEGMEHHYAVAEGRLRFAQAAPPFTPLCKAL